MKQTVTREIFIDMFNKKGRERSFSFEGFNALYDYLIEDEENTGENLDFDPIALDCKFTEYENLKKFHNDFNKEYYPDLESIQNDTTLINIDDESFIIQNF